MKKYFALLVSILIIVLSIGAYAESNNNSWGFGDSSFGNLQMPEMPSLNQGDWWGDFSTPSDWGSFSFGDFSTPAYGNWGDIGSSGFGDMSSAFDSFKDSALNGMNKESSLPDTSGANDELGEAFNNQKDSVLNGLSQPSNNVQSLYNDIFGSGGDRTQYSDLGQATLPITFDELKSRNDDLPSVNKSTYDQISQLASTTKINSIINSSSSSPDATFSNLPTLSIGGSAEDHTFASGNLSSKYNNYKGSLETNFKPDESEYKGLYNSQKASLGK